MILDIKRETDKYDEEYEAFKVVCKNITINDMIEFLQNNLSKEYGDYMIKNDFMPLVDTFIASVEKEDKTINFYEI